MRRRGEKAALGARRDGGNRRRRCDPASGASAPLASATDAVVEQKTELDACRWAPRRRVAELGQECQPFGMFGRRSHATGDRSKTRTGTTG